MGSRGKKIVELCTQNMKSNVLYNCEIIDNNVINLVVNNIRGDGEKLDNEVESSSNECYNLNNELGQYFSEFNKKFLRY